MRFGPLAAFVLAVFTTGAAMPALAQSLSSFKADELSCAAVYEVAGKANAPDAPRYDASRKAIAGAFQARTGASQADLQKAIEVRAQSLTKTLGIAGIEPYVAACDSKYPKAVSAGN